MRGGNQPEPRIPTEAARVVVRDNKILRQVGKHLDIWSTGDHSIENNFVKSGRILMRHEQLGGETDTCVSNKKSAPDVLYSHSYKYRLERD